MCPSCSFQPLGSFAFLFSRSTGTLVGQHAFAQAAFRLLPSFPEPETANNRLGIVAQPATWWKCLQILHIATPKDHVIGLKRGNQTLDNILDIAQPLIDAVFLQRTPPHIIFKGSV